MTQWWHRIRRVADTPSRLLGLPGAGGRALVAGRRGALGEDDPLTVLVGTAERAEQAAVVFDPDIAPA